MSPISAKLGPIGAEAVLASPQPIRRNLRKPLVSKGLRSISALENKAGRAALTTSPYATTALVFAAIASTASLPLVRDDRETPLWWDRMAGVKPLICPTCQEEYFLG